MTFSAWLAKLTDIVNLGKIVVDGGPGTLLAVALIIILSHTSSVPVLPIGTSFENKRKEVQKEVETAREDVAERERSVQSITIELAAIANRLGTLRTELESFRAQRSQLELHGIASGSVRYDALIQREQELLGEIRGQDRDLASREGTKARESARLAHARTALEDPTRRLEALIQRRVESGTDILNLVLDHLIGLVLVGYLLGTLLSPLNRALFINFVDWILTKPSNQLATDLATFVLGGVSPHKSSDAKAHAHRHAELRLGTAAISPKKIAPGGADIDDAVAENYLSPTYFVGRKVISREELEALVAGYYRWTEASMNLVIPIVALGVAAMVQYRNWGGGSVLAGSGVLSFFLFRSARRRNLDYKQRLSDFIEGRLQRYEEEAAQREKAKTLDEVVLEAQKLLEKISAMEKKDK